MDSNKRPETMERITTPALAAKFIDEQVAQVRAQVGDKKVLLASWSPFKSFLVNRPETVTKNQIKYCATQIKLINLLILFSLFEAFFININIGKTVKD